MFRAKIIFSTTLFLLSTLSFSAERCNSTETESLDSQKERLERNLQKNGQSLESLFTPSLSKTLFGKNPPKSMNNAVETCGENSFCTLSTLLSSEESALRILSIYLETGYVLSLNQEIFDFDSEEGVEIPKEILDLYQNKSDSLWSSSELRQMDTILKLAPSFLKNLPSLQSIHRIGFRSEDGIQALSFGKTSKQAGTILFFPNVFDSETGLEHTVIHELSHHYDFSYQVRKKTDWSKHHWKNEGTSKNPIWMMKDQDLFVSKYAMKSPSEDFAETMTFFILQHQELYQKYSLEWDFLQNHLEKESVQKTRYLPQDLASQVSPNTWEQVDLLKLQKNMLRSIQLVQQDRFFRTQYSISEFKDDRMNYKYVTYYGNLVELFSHKMDYASSKDLFLNLLHESIPSYCEQGGDAKFSKVFESEFRKNLEPVIQLISQALRNEPPQAVIDCMLQKDLRSSCFAEKILEPLHSLHFDSEWNEIVYKIFSNKIDYPNSYYSKVIELMGEKEIALACLSSYQNVSINPNLRFDVTYLYEEIESSESLLQLSRGMSCRESTKKALLDQGYILPDMFLQETKVIKSIIEHNNISAWMNQFSESFLSPALKTKSPESKKKLYENYKKKNPEFSDLSWENLLEYLPWIL